MRLFVGISLASAVTAELDRACAKLRMRGDGLRWSAAEFWHVTLQFLGNASAEQFACLKLRLADVQSAAVPVRLGGLGVFDRAGVFHAGVELTEELVELQRRVVEATRRCGFVPETRVYHPHITLARAKGDGRRQLKELKSKIRGFSAFTPFVAKEFLLYESHLGPGGSKYEVRARFGLGAELTNARISQPG